jgi:hypothetical protein
MESTLPANVIEPIFVRLHRARTEQCKVDGVLLMRSWFEGFAMRRAAILLGILAACGGKKAGRDCDGYAAKVIDLSNPTPESLGMVEKVSKEACTSGRVTDAQLACAEKAATREALIECTLGPRPTRPPDLPPTPSGQVVFKGAVNAGDRKVLDSAFNEDQRKWIDSLKRDVAACSRADEKYEPNKYVIVVTFGGGPPAVTPPRDLPPAVGECVIPLLAKMPPVSVKNGPAEFYIAVGN